MKTNSELKKDLEEQRENNIDLEICNVRLGQDLETAMKILSSTQGCISLDQQKAYKRLKDKYPTIHNNISNPINKIKKYLIG